MSLNMVKVTILAVVTVCVFAAFGRSDEPTHKQEDQKKLPPYTILHSTTVYPKCKAYVDTNQ